MERMAESGNGLPSVWRCCADRVTETVFRIVVKDGVCIVLCCAEHEVQTGLMLDSLRHA